jgi:hypothetical protein
VDCVSEDERTASADGGLEDLFFGGGFGEGLFLFNGNVAKFCRIKDFSAFLTLNKFGVLFAGDNFDDGMFALGGHFGEVFANVMDFARLWACCQQRFRVDFSAQIRGEVVVNSWWKEW